MQAVEEPPAAEPQQQGQPDENWFDNAAGAAGTSEIRLFTGLVVLKHPDFEEWAADVLANRQPKNTSDRLGQALLARDQETLHLIVHLLAHYPGEGKTIGVPTAHNLKQYLDRENLKEKSTQRSQLKGPIVNKKHLRRSLHAKHSIALLVQSDGRKMYDFMLRRGGEEDRKESAKKDALKRQLHESKVALAESHNETAAALAGAEAASDRRADADRKRSERKPAQRELQRDRVKRVREETKEKVEDRMNQKVRCLTTPKSHPTPLHD